MAPLYATAVRVLSEIVGPIPAQMCMRSACVEIGKAGESLSSADFEAVAKKIRTDMSRFASPELLESALMRIRERL